MQSAAPVEKLSTAASKHLLIKKTAEYRHLGQEEDLPLKSKSPSPKRQFAVRIKSHPRLSSNSSVKCVQPSLPTSKPTPHYSSSDMFELIKQLASDTGVRHYKSFEKKILKIGAPLSPEDYETFAPTQKGPQSSSPKLRINHPLIVDSEGKTAGGVLALPQAKRSPWSEHSAFPIPVQPRGSAVTYTIGRKNWLREHDQQIRVAKIRRAFATHR